MIISETQPISILRRDLNKAQIQRASLEEQALFLTIAHVTNEINALLRAAVWSSDFNSPLQAKVDGQITLSLIFIKLLAGKLYEAYQVIQKAYFKSALSKTYNARLQPDAQNALSEIKRYFDGKNTIHTIRNNFAFHYSPEELSQILPSVSEDLTLYMQHDGGANNLFYFAEVIAAQALFQAIGTPYNQTAINDLAAEIIGLARDFAVLFGDLMAAFLKTIGKDAWETSAQPVTFDQLPMFNDIYIPWFTDTSNIIPSSA